MRCEFWYIFVSNACTFCDYIIILLTIAGWKIHFYTYSLNIRWQLLTLWTITTKTGFSRP